MGGWARDSVSACRWGGDAVGAEVGAGPLIHRAGLLTLRWVGEPPVAPAGEGLGPVVPTAQAGQVCRAGLAGWPALVERYVGLEVVEVSGAGTDRAAGELTVPVPQHHELAHPGRRVVRVDRVGSRRVEHRPDGHP